MLVQAEATHAKRTRNAPGSVLDAQEDHQPLLNAHLAVHGALPARMPILWIGALSHRGGPVESV